MRAVEYIPSIERLVAIAEGLQLSKEDVRHVHRVKNYLRNRAAEKSVLSPNKVNPISSFSGARGITI